MVMKGRREEGITWSWRAFLGLRVGALPLMPVGENWRQTEIIKASEHSLKEHLLPPSQCSFTSWWQCISTAHCCGYGGRKGIHRTGTRFQEQEIFLSYLDSTLPFLLHQPRLRSCLSVPPEHQTFTVIPSLTHALLFSQYGNYCC